jgi:NAD(P)-dependent dehydrogenase (short-subunit alcohol dehydrogenase family)
LNEARSTLGPKALAFSADVSKLSDLDGLYSKLKPEFGHLDAVFANAGYSQFGPFEVVRGRPGEKEGQAIKDVLRTYNPSKRLAARGAAGDREAGRILSIR